MLTTAVQVESALNHLFRREASRVHTCPSSSRNLWSNFKTCALDRSAAPPKCLAERLTPLLMDPLDFNRHFRRAPISRRAARTSQDMLLGMSTLREIEAAIELLPVPELAEFARWIERRRARIQTKFEGLLALRRRKLRPDPGPWRNRRAHHGSPFRARRIRPASSRLKSQWTGRALVAHVNDRRGLQVAAQLGIGVVAHDHEAKAVEDRKALDVLFGGDSDSIEAPQDLAMWAA